MINNEQNIIVCKTYVIWQYIPYGNQENHHSTKATLERGTGAVLCTTDRLSAFDSQNLIVPIWGI